MYILIKVLVSINRLRLSPWSFTHAFKQIETTIKWNCISKASSFLQITAEQQDCPVFTVFLTTKLDSKISRQQSCRLRLNCTDIETLLEWTLLWTILEKQFLVLRNKAASKTGNDVISLLWQLRCNCNPDYNKSSSSSNAGRNFSKSLLLATWFMLIRKRYWPWKPYRAVFETKKTSKWRTLWHRKIRSSSLSFR